MKVKKHFGQYFLSNRTILQTMVDAADVSKKDIVLEIGPGRGTLTTLLAERAKKVTAIEKDRDLIPFLQEKFRSNKNVEIVEGDVLKSDPNIRIHPNNTNKLSDHSYVVWKYSDRHRYKIVANIPYYITGHFLRLFLENDALRPSMMVLMIQKEVADRIVMGKASLLSLSIKAYGKPEIIRKVPRGAFVPPPNVDSAIIKISDISDHWFKKNHLRPEKFFEILRHAFQNKRKMLKKSLKTLSNTECLTLGEFANKRPEDLSLEDWARIFKP